MKTKIQGYTFEVSEPYAEGQTMNAVEAQVLNQTRAENIGNNQRKAVQAAIDGQPTVEDANGKEGPEPLNGEQVAELQAELSVYDETYVLNMTRGGRTRDPIEAMARTIARTLIEKEVKAQGKTLKAWREEVGNDAYKAKIAEIASKKKVIAHAQRTVSLDI